jgi:hypothetical protein
VKTVKFESSPVLLITSGEKTSTWRLFDDKDLSIGDEIALQKFGHDKPFAKATIVEVVRKPFRELTDKDKTGHESYESDDEMYATYSGYYKTKVGQETEVKIISFALT